MDHLKGWDVVYKAPPHGKLPVPNNENYNIDPNTYDGEFFQEDGLTGHFEIDLTEAQGMEVDNDSDGDKDEKEEVENEMDMELLNRLHLGNDSDDDISPLDHQDDYLYTRDSDDETYDRADPNDDDYF
jgi:hypothetical protein